jgi:predicted alpha/beta-fold hydrolase
MYRHPGNTLAGLQLRSQLIISQDDPIIPIVDLANVARTECLRIETPRFGGHSGFLMNWRLRGWIDRRLLELFV